MSPSLSGRACICGERQERAALGRGRLGISGGAFSPRGAAYGPRISPTTPFGPLAPWKMQALHPACHPPVTHCHPPATHSVFVRRNAAKSHGTAVRCNHRAAGSGKPSNQTLNNTTTRVRLIVPRVNAEAKIRLITACQEEGLPRPAALTRPGPGGERGGGPRQGGGGDGGDAAVQPGGGGGGCAMGQW